MNNKIQIENFRLFKDNTSFDISPITILTGCNNSGKSSITKAISLLANYISSLRETHTQTGHIDLASCRLDFSSMSSLRLASYSESLNKDNGNTTMSFTISTFSKKLLKDVDVKFVFDKDENDVLDCGALCELSIKADDIFIYRSYKTTQCIYNYNYLAEAYKKFVSYIDYRNDCKELLTQEIREKKAYSKEQDIYKITEKINGLAEQCGIHQKKIENIIQVPAYIKGFIKESSKDYVASIHKDIFYLPILEQFAKLSKIDACNLLRNYKESINERRLDTAFSRIIRDLRNDSNDMFFDYYKKLEREYLHTLSDTFNNNRFLVSGAEFPYIKPNHIDVSSLKILSYNIINHSRSKFVTLYNVLLQIQEDCTAKGETPASKDLPQAFFTYVEDTINDAILNSLPIQPKVASIADVSVKRMYSLDSNSEFVSAVKLYLEACRTNHNKAYKPNTFIDKWFRKYQLGHKIRVHLSGEGSGIAIKVYQDENDTEGRLLADCGYGVTQFYTLLLRIETAIIERKEAPAVNIGNYIFPYPSGVANRKPFMHYENKSTIFSEEPEIHLHPKYQSLLAEMFYDAYINYGIEFVIETHSEYLIRKFQSLVAQKKLNPEVITMYYLYSPTDDIPSYMPKIKKIGIEEDGCLSDSFGTGFYDEKKLLSKELRNAQIQNMDEN